MLRLRIEINFQMLSLVGRARLNIFILLFMFLTHYIMLSEMPNYADDNNNDSFKFIQSNYPWGGIESFTTLTEREGRNR